MVASPDDCAAQLHVCATRVTLLAANGMPLVGVGSSYVSDALMTATLTPVYNAGTEIKENNACGATIIDFLDDPTLVRGDIALDFLTPDPYLHAILISQGAQLAPAGGGVGFAYPPIGQVSGNGVSLELFTKRIVKGVQSQVFPWAHWAVPFVKSLQLGARTFDGTTAQHSLITGQCYENPNFEDGPFEDFAAPSDRFAQWIPCLTIPTPQCGPVAVVAS